MSGDSVQFGLYEFNCHTGELRREGNIVRLQSQPAQVLAVLVRNHGQIVSREELQQAVWDKDTFVDFDRGLNFCIAQIRSALGDSADSPRYVRTHPKRGYEFIAPVSVSAPAVDVIPPTPPASRVRLIVACAVIAMASIGLSLFRLSATKNAEPLTVAVVRFDNETGNDQISRFADNLTDTLVAELTTNTTIKLSVIGNAASLRKPRSFRDLPAIAESLGARIIIVGQVQPYEPEAGGAPRVRVLAHLIRMPGEKHLWVARRDGAAVNSGKQVAELARGMAAELIEHLLLKSASR